MKSLIPVALLSALGGVAAAPTEAAAATDEVAFASGPMNHPSRNKLAGRSVQSPGAAPSRTAAAGATSPARR